MRGLLVVGLLAYAVANSWRDIAKGGIRLGVRTGRRLAELSEKAVSDIEDLTAEAVAEEDARSAAKGAQGAQAASGD